MKLVLSILLVICSCQVFGEELKTKQQLIDLSDKFMSIIDDGDIEKALEFVTPYWPIPKHEIDGMAYKMNSQMPKIKERFGDSIETIHIKNMIISDSFYKRIYLQKFTNHALVWYISFYRPDDNWRINTLTFDDRIDRLYTCEGYLTHNSKNKKTCK